MNGNTQHTAQLEEDRLAADMGVDHTLWASDIVWASRPSGKWKAWRRSDNTVACSCLVLRRLRNTQHVSTTNSLTSDKGVGISAVWQVGRRGGAETKYAAAFGALEPWKAAWTCFMARLWVQEKREEECCMCVWCMFTTMQCSILRAVVKV